MKKKTLLGLMAIITLLTITGCETKTEKRNIDYLMKEYIKAYTEANLAAAKNIFPPYYVKYAKDYLTQEMLDQSLQEAKEEYGEDFTMTYKIYKTTKLTAKELEEFNTKIKKQFKTDEKAKECYKYEGILTYTGSEKEDNQSMYTFAYCKYADTWYLARK